MEIDFKSQFIGLAFSVIISLIIFLSYKDHRSSPFQRYLTFWPRFWAPYVDALILWPVTINLILIASFLSSHLYLLILDVFGILIYFLYSIFFHWRYGATVGKMCTKVKVLDAKTERPITLKQSIKRDAVPMIIYIGLLLYLLINFSLPAEVLANHTAWASTIWLLWYIAEIITMLTNDKRRALHDFIAGTVVVRSDLD